VLRNGAGRNGSAGSRQSDLELFPGFVPAIKACLLDWDNHPIPGVTYGQNSHYQLSPFVGTLKNNTQTHSQVKCELNQLNMNLKSFSKLYVIRTCGFL
jgi:hypothetical protein